MANSYLALRKPKRFPWVMLFVVAVPALLLVGVVIARATLLKERDRHALETDQAIRANEDRKLIEKLKREDEEEKKRRERELEEVREKARQEVQDALRRAERNDRLK